jgi:hypothetical protein
MILSVREFMTASEFRSGRDELLLGIYRCREFPHHITQPEPLLVASDRLCR